MDDRIAVPPPPHTGQGEAADRLSVLRCRHVHVEEGVGREPALEHPGREPCGEGGGGLEPKAAAADGRDGQRRHAEQRPLHRRGDRARVRHVVAQVRSLVDPREDELGAPAEDAVDGEGDAVGRRPVDGVAAGPDLLDPQRPVQGERVAHRAAFAIGRDHDHVAEPSHRAGERREPFGVHAVIVANQDERRRRHAGGQGATKVSTLQAANGAETRPAASSARRVGASRFERPTTRTPSECATWLRHAPAARTRRRGPICPRRAPSLGAVRQRVKAAASNL